jgi:hypothetical protein
VRFFFLPSLLLSKFVQQFLSYIKYIVFINLLANQCIALFDCCIDSSKIQSRSICLQITVSSLSDFSETNLVFTFKNKTKPHPSVISELCQLAPPAEQLYKQNLQEYLTAKVALTIRISIPSSNGQRTKTIRGLIERAGKFVFLKNDGQESTVTVRFSAKRYRSCRH